MCLLNHILRKKRFCIFLNRIVSHNGLWKVDSKEAKINEAVLKIIFILKSTKKLIVSLFFFTYFYILKPYTLMEKKVHGEARSWIHFWRMFSMYNCFFFLLITSKHSLKKLMNMIKTIQEVCLKHIFLLFTSVFTCRTEI